MASINSLTTRFFPLPLVPPPQLISWFGMSGVEYTFTMRRIGAWMPSYAGLYIFAIESGWNALYVGESEDLSDRVGANLRQHHRYAEAVRWGATHIGTLEYPGALVRLLAEKDLINGIQPPLNCQ